MSPITATPVAYAGRRVVVVGAGDSAAQVANELAPVATGDRSQAVIPLRFIPQRLDGHDIHHWLRETGFDTLPAPWLDQITGGSVITDSVGFQHTLARGLLDTRPMFTALDADGVVWGRRAPASPSTRSCSPPATAPASTTFADLGALDAHGLPLHAGGISTTHLGLVYLGLEFERSFASNTLRGVSSDAAAVIAPLLAWIHDAPATVGLGSSRRQALKFAA